MGSSMIGPRLLDCSEDQRRAIDRRQLGAGDQPVELVQATIDAGFIDRDVVHRPHEQRHSARHRPEVDSHHAVMRHVEATVDRREQRARPALIGRGIRELVVLAPPERG